MLALEPLREGSEYELNIEWVLNNVEPWDWPNCWCGSIEGEGEIHEVEWERAVTTREKWAALLECKRTDGQYESIVDSIREFGFLAPVTVRLGMDGSVDTWGDGHHRLAAMIDLGYKTIPTRAISVIAGRSATVRSDSGSEGSDEWDLDVDGVQIGQALALRGY